MQAEEPAPRVAAHACEPTMPAKTERVFVTEAWGAPSVETMLLLATALGSDAEPQPVRVTARDPTPTLRSEATENALASWLRAGSRPPFVPTASQLYSWQRENLLNLADPATATLAAEAERARPSAMDPAGLMEAAHKAGWDRAAPALHAPQPPTPAMGPMEHPSVHAGNLFAAHKAICGNCTEGRACHVAAGINLLAAADFPWENNRPPTLPVKAPTPIPYTPELAAAIAELRGLGVLVAEPPENIRAYHHLFDAEKYEPSLSPEEEAAIAGDATGGAAAKTAERRAHAFTGSYEAALKATDSSDGAVRCAWNAATRALPGSVKHRLVLDMSKATSWFRKQPLRLAALHEFIAQCPKGSYLGKFDLSKGYYLVRLSREASLYCGVCVQLEPGGQPVHLTYRRLPMGASPSAYIFSILTGTIREIAQARMPPGVVLHCYLDDFYFCAPTEAAAKEAAKILLQLFAEVGITDNPKKRAGPSTKETVLGVTIDTANQAVSLPPGSSVKLATLAHILERCAAKNLPVPAHALPTLAGNAIWGGVVDELLPPYTRALAACMQGLQPKWWRYTASTYRWPAGDFNSALVSELQWLAHHLRTRGLRAHRLLKQAHRKALMVASDASGATNCVAVVTESIAWRFHLEDCTGVKLAVLEALALPLLYGHLGVALRHASVVHASDALGVCFWAATGKARDDAGNDLCKLARHGRAAGEVEATSAWLSRSDNYLADRGAAMPWRQACEEDLADCETPQRLVEVTVRGLPCDFLKTWALSIDADFKFAEKAWHTVHPRGT